MNTLGLKDGDRLLFEDALRSTHRVRVLVNVTDLQGAVVSRLVDPKTGGSEVLIDGQVTVDRDADVTRTASLTLLDPTHALSFDTDSPDDGALYADRMIQVIYGVYVEALGRWVDVPVFLGPVTKLDRARDVVTVEAQGKETLAAGAIWRTLKLTRGTRSSDAIRTLMINRAGEGRVSVAKGRGPKLPKARNLDRTLSIWETAQSFARGMGEQLFYTGDGTLTLRKRPENVVYTFTDGDGGDVLSDVQVSYELTDLKNTIQVLGKKPEGKGKQRVRAQATAPRDHPLSPWRLGRTGAPKYLPETIEDTSIRTRKDAAERARATLSARLAETVTVAFDSLPIPHLEPGDKVRVKTGDFTTTFYLRQFTIPLTPSGDPVMSVGYFKKTTPNRRRIRR
ncbi:hypothetical protein [Nocardioides ochotonae]|uniref:hypothetical protein n=1 Tax=Nocardioides ochotonae TaxID=2685869 RepID=UPI001409342B|nr:hypothetical protein [Nocardioides ochotonae]